MQDLFPLTNPVAIVALAMGVFLVAPLVTARLRIPSIVGLIIAGAIVGPNGLNLLERDITIILLGTVGLLYLMFLAGTEIDIFSVKKYRNHSILFGITSFLIPMGLGIGVGLLLGYPLVAALLMASLFASHTLLTFPIASRMGITRNRAVTAAVGGTIVTDTLALMVLAIIAASTRGALDAAFWTQLGVLLSLYLVATLFILPRIAAWFFRRQQESGVSEFVFVLTAVFTGAFSAQMAGLEPIIGAFLAGLALNRLIPAQSLLHNRLHFVGEAIFIPFFLLSVGMLVDMSMLLGDWRVLQVMAVMTATVILTKLLAAKLAQRMLGYSSTEGWLLFGLSVPQAAATLAITLIGLEIGLFDDAILNGAIAMILVSCILGPSIMETYGRRAVLEESESREQMPDTRQRILIPMANPATLRSLMDLALLIRQPDLDEALYPLTVVPGTTSGAAHAVSDAEKLLNQAVAHAGGAGVNVIPTVRVDHNFADGIHRGVSETGANTILVGWDGKRSPGKWVFGSVLDQLLHGTEQELIVAKLSHPLNVTKRLVVILPKGFRHMPGHGDTVRTLKRMANSLSASLQVYVIDEGTDPYTKSFETAKPSAPVEVERLSSWQKLFTFLPGQVRADDLVLSISARRGALTWHPAMQRLPGFLADLLPKSFILFYPAELERRSETYLMGSLPVRNVLLGQPETDVKHALESLFAARFGPKQAQDLLFKLAAQMGDKNSEVREGVLLLNSRLEWLNEPQLFLLGSAAGMTLPERNDTRVHLMFIVLSPQDAPVEHLKQLAELGTIIGDDKRLKQLRQASSIEELTTPVG